jgi:hypothetical protein
MGYRQRQAGLYNKQMGYRQRQAGLYNKEMGYRQRQECCGDKREGERRKKPKHETKNNVIVLLCPRLPDIRQSIVSRFPDFARLPFWQ